MRYGLLYVAGHAATVAVLGSVAVVFRLSLPAASDRWAERLVGVTLLVLGFMCWAHSSVLRLTVMPVLARASRY